MELQNPDLFNRLHWIPDMSTLLADRRKAIFTLEIAFGQKKGMISVKFIGRGESTKNRKVDFDNLAWSSLAVSPTFHPIWLLTVSSGINFQVALMSLFIR